MGMPDLPTSVDFGEGGASNPFSAPSLMSAPAGPGINAMVTSSDPRLPVPPLQCVSIEVSCTSEQLSQIITAIMGVTNSTAFNVSSRPKED